MNKQAEKFFELGKLHYFKGNLDKAQKFFKKAYQLDSKDPKISNNLGVVLKIRGDLRWAKHYFKKAIKTDSGFSSAYSNLANVLVLESKFFEAEKYYDQAINLDENHADAVNNLANLKRLTGKTEEAYLLYNKALKMNSRNSGIKNNLAVIEYESGNLKESIKRLKMILAIDKNNFDAWYNLGLVYLKLGEYAEAYEVFSHANKINPNSEIVLNSLIICAKHLCEWESVKMFSKKLNFLTNKAIKKKKLPGETPYLINTNSDNAKKKLEVAKAWASYYRQKTKNYKKFDFSRETKRGDRKIRVGYLSNNFNNHAVAHVVKDLFKSHDKKQFRLYAYSFGAPDDSRWFHDIKNSFNVFRDIRKLGYYQAAKRIYEDKVDILVDMVGYMSGARPEIMALRPAPVIVNFIGLFGTTGGLADYVVGDKLLIPPKQKKYYSEKVLYLPDCYQPNSSRGVEFFSGDDKRERATDRAMIFSCFNRSYKIEDKMFRSWMKILKRVPKSVLWLWEESELASKNLKKVAKECGVNPKRLVFSGTQKFEDHLRRQSLVDVSLDTFPYSGGATTSNSLWTGVPVVTLAGKSYSSRMSSSLVNAMGMKELSVDTFLEYENLAVNLATNKNKLKSMVKRLKEGVNSMPLFDIDLYARSLEFCYKNLVKK